MASFVDQLTQNYDKYDVNTVGGLLNRLNDLNDKQSMADKYNFEPEKDPINFVFYKKQSEKFWDNTEIKFSQDLDDYKHADPRLKRMLKIILGFFAGGDGLVTANLAFRFLFEAKSMIELSALLYQAHQEVIHAENYVTTLKTLLPNDEERNQVLSYADTLPCVAKKAKLMEKYKDANIPKAYRYLSYAASEGIFFWASFSVIFWFRRQLNDRGEMMFKIIVTSNTQIASDETLHRDYGAVRYRDLPIDQRLPQDTVYQLIDEFVVVEKEFASEILPEPYQDLNAPDIHTFIEFMADQLLVGLGYEKLYGHEKFPETMPWMAVGSRTDKGNFYEVDVTSYRQHTSNNEEYQSDQDPYDADLVDF